MALTERERTILDVERSWWTGDAAFATKEAAIRQVLGLSSTRYYVLLGHLVESADAEREDPLLVRRLRKVRAERRRARFENGTLGARSGR